MIKSRLLALHQTRNVNSPLCVLAIVILGVLNVAILFIAPVLIGAMVDILGFTEAEAGYVISIELAGMCLATLPALYWATRVNWRKALLAALSGMILGNLLCVGTDTFASLLVLRFLVGVAAGSSMAICLAIIGLTRNPDRVFALWVTGQLVFGTVGLFLLPSLLPSLGYGFIYLLVAVLTIGMLFLLRFLPQQRQTLLDQEPRPGGVAERAPHVLLWATAGLFSIFAYYVGQYSIWAYLDRIGVAIGLTPETVGQALSLATIIGIGGALGAAALGARLGRLLPIALGSAISISAMSFLIDDFSGGQYLFAACVFSFTFNFILPYLMACVAAVDVSGRLIMLSNISSGGGLAVGPALAAVLQEEMGFNVVIWTGMALTLLSLFFIARLAVYKTSSHG